MASVLPSVVNKSDFDDEGDPHQGARLSTRRAKEPSQDTGQPALVREIIAKRIIEGLEAAKEGRA